MKKLGFLVLVLCLLNLSKSEHLTIHKLNNIVRPNFLIKSQNHTIQNLKGSSNDIDVNDVDIEKNKDGFKYYASGKVTLSHSDSYVLLIYGFSEGEPTESDILNFKEVEIPSRQVTFTFPVAIGSNNKNVDRFSCYACDEYTCYGMEIHFSSITIGTIVIIVVVIVILIILCAVGGYCYYKKRNKNKMLNKSTGIRINENLIV